MSRTILRLTADHLPELVSPCRSCAFWQCDPVRREQVEDPAAEVDAWVSEVLREWGSCGRVAMVDGRAVGHVFYAPEVFLPGLIRGQCVSKDGFNYLEAHVKADPADPRTDEINGDVNVGGLIAKDWGLHLIDANIAMGNLVDIVGQQAKAYVAKK